MKVGQLNGRFLKPLLSILCAFVIRVKIIFQALWLQSLPWDSLVERTSQAPWSVWCSKLRMLKGIKFLRYLFAPCGIAPGYLQIDI